MRDTGLQFFVGSCSVKGCWGECREQLCESLCRRGGFTAWVSWVVLGGCFWLGYVLALHERNGGAGRYFLWVAFSLGAFFLGCLFFFAFGADAIEENAGRAHRWGLWGTSSPRKALGENGLIEFVKKNYLQA